MAKAKTQSTLRTDEELAGLARIDAWKLLWPEFIRWALMQEREQNRQNWRSDLWVLARLVKSWWKIGTSPIQAWPHVDSAVKAAGGWEAQGIDLTGEDLIAEFCKCWDKARYRADEDPLTQALAKAKATPLGLCDENKRTEGYREFISLAAWLQVTRGDGNIALPTRRLGELLHVRPNTISVWIGWAVADRYLSREKEAVFHPNNPKANRAAEYRLAVQRWDCLKELCPWASE